MYAHDDLNLRILCSKALFRLTRLISKINGLDTLADFPPFLIREITFMTSYLLSWMQSFFSQGEQIFLLIVDPFSGGSKNNFDRVFSLESVSIPFKGHELQQFTEHRIGLL